MQAKTFTGAALEKALKDNSLTHSGVMLTGMVKASQKDGFISFTRSGCDSWVDLPTDMIEQAEQLGQNTCRDHSHTVMRITLKEPKDAEARIIAALLAQPAPVQRPAGMAQEWPAPVPFMYQNHPAESALSRFEPQGLGQGFLVPLRRNVPLGFGGGGGLGFDCFGNVCICNSDDDCNGMFSSGRCGGPYAKCWIRGGNVFCMCSQSFA